MNHTADSSKATVFWVCLLLAMLTLGAFGRVCANDFVNYDDPSYVTANPFVQTGLSVQNLKWDFTTFHTGNWHPLTWLSLQIDHQLLGLKPWGYHLTNLLLHTVNTVLLFWFFFRTTDRIVLSALMALLFAVHPLHVESVAWVSERKDVLSTFFWILTLLTYGWYAERPSLKRYLPVVAAVAVGLMAKPTLVTLPCVLLLLDYWPLSRLNPALAATATTRGATNAVAAGLSADDKGVKGRFPSLVSRFAEKLPLFLLAGISCVVTFVAQQSANTIRSFETWPLSVRIMNSLAAYATYIRKMLWPVDLGVFYPRAATDVLIRQALLAAVLICVVTGLVIWQRRRRPYLLVGWFWYLGTLVPVIGLVQVGDQAFADRYSYVPLIGLFIMVVWTTEGMFSREHLRARSDAHSQMLAAKRMIADGGFRRLAALAVSMLALVGCVASSWLQIGYWHDSEKLWRRALSVTRDNETAEWNLAVYLQKQGRAHEALLHWLEAARLKPEANSHFQVGNLFLQQQRLDQAEYHFSQAVRLQTDFADAYVNLGMIASRRGNLQDAINRYQRALQIDPAHAAAHNNLGFALVRQGKIREGYCEYAEAIRLNPDFDLAYENLGNAYSFSGDWVNAVANYRKAIKISPTVARYHYALAVALGELGHHEEAKIECAHGIHLDPRWPVDAARQAWELATHRDPKIRQPALAIHLAKQACAAADPPPPQFLLPLAAAYVEADKVNEAMAAARQGLKLAEDAGRADLVERFRDLLQQCANRRTRQGSG